MTGNVVTIETDVMRNSAHTIKGEIDAQVSIFGNINSITDNARSTVLVSETGNALVAKVDELRGTFNDLSNRGQNVSGHLTSYAEGLDGDVVQGTSTMNNFPSA